MSTYQARKVVLRANFSEQLKDNKSRCYWIALKISADMRNGMPRCARSAGASHSEYSVSSRSTKASGALAGGSAAAVVARARGCVCRVSVTSRQRTPAGVRHVLSIRVIRENRHYRADGGPDDFSRQYESDTGERWPPRSARVSKLRVTAGYGSELLFVREYHVRECLAFD